MCGINGIISSHTPDKADVIQKMNQRLSHRGPDDEDQWIEGDVALGHRRLSVIDLSASGHQPMVSACGRYVMVYMESCSPQ